MSGQFLMIRILSNDWINLTFIVIFILLVVNKLLFQKRFTLLANTFFGKEYFSVYIKDTPLAGNTFNIIFLPINLLTVGLTIFYISKAYFPGAFQNYNFKTYLLIVISILIFKILKVVLSIIINHILDTYKTFRRFSFFKLSYRNVISIILLPFLIIHQYSILSNSITLTLLISVFIGLTVIQYLQSSYLIISQKQQSILYLFLYLCTLEIIPFIIYVKLTYIIIDNFFITF